MKQLIDTVICLGKSGVLFRDHDEKDNPRVFRIVLDLLSKVNPDLKTQCETATVFKRNSKTFQNEILDIAFNIVDTSLMRFETLQFLANDNTDVSNKT